MRVRDILVLIIVAATIPAAFFRPFYGLLGFSWLAYMRPQDLSWGLAATLPLSKFVALAVWVSLILRGKVIIVRSTLVTWVMIGLWAWLLVATFTAEHPEIAKDKFYDISKVFLISLLTLVIVWTRERFTISVAVIAFSLGLLGLKFGMFGLLQGGVHFTKGVGGMIGDNNDFALALCMNLPLLVYLSTLMQKRWLRWAAIGLVPLTAVTVVFTHSRGGFLSLAAVTATMIFTSRRRLPALLVTAGLVAVGSLAVPESYYERIRSIADFQSDASAVGRLNAWRAALYMANDYPFTGVGLDNFMSLFPFYAPDPDNIKVAHNTYLQMLAETGYIGLWLYLTLIGATFWTLETARRRAKRLRLVWAQNGAKYLGASMIAFMVGATFLNRAHFDLTYHVMFLAACMKRIVGWEEKAMRAEARAAAPAAADAAPPAPANRRAELVVR